HNPADVESALRAWSGRPPFPPAADRDAWDGRRAALGEDGVRALEHAAALAGRPLPSNRPASLILDWLRNPGRSEAEFDGSLAERRSRLASLALAECLEGGGRFLEPILDTAWSICEESGWAHPTHTRGLADPDRPVIDLRAAMIALELAELDHLLGPRLDPTLGKRIRRELDRRCFAPFLERHDFWWLHNTGVRTVNNWTAVCVGGVVGAALYLEPDPARLAEIVARGARSLDDYLATFDEDGGSSEGPGYWSYGFGYYTVVAHLVENRTDGRVDFFAPDRVRQIARYPLRTILSPGLYVNFSDCDRRVGLSAPHLAYLARRLDAPDVMALANAQAPERRRDQLTWGLRALWWAPEGAAGTTVVPARHDFFRGMHWMVARADPTDPGALVLAAKGGHNGEMHNQNDVGSVIVHLGEASIVADPGRGRYTQAYFGPRRYEHFVNSSRGHSVPLVNGLAQLPGGEHRAELLDHRATEDEDVLVLEMRDAYPGEADLASLRRTVAMHRAPSPRVEIEDVARFARGPGTLESALITFGRVESGHGQVVLAAERTALRVEYDPAVVEARVEEVPEVDLAEGPTEMRRVAFALRQPADEVAIRLRLTPV
ncbi:MAG TPA: heparinase II/III family protein, partial [Chloroflexota bacterium]